MDALFVNLVTVASSEESHTISSLLMKATPVVKAVLVVLVLMSVVCWYIIVYKWATLRRAGNETTLFLEAFWQSKRLDAIYQTSEDLKRSPVSQVFRAGYIELTKLKSGHDDGDTMHGQLGDIDNIERSLRRAASSEILNLEALTPFLATTASAAPFVGLFGTVWGIMDSFMNIAAKGNATLGTVAPGIAEALIATAIGLVAAIPAVMAYNYFINRVHVLEAAMEHFSADFLNIVKRHFYK